MSDWEYYNHALVSILAPHELPNVSQLHDWKLWDTKKGKALLARWTTDFDCGCETGWWYCIKDKPFDIREVKADVRYKIRKGLKNFDIRLIDPVEYAEDLYHVQVEAYNAYPTKYRPNVGHASFVRHMEVWRKHIVIGAFCREDGVLAGYALLSRRGKCIELVAQKAIPDYERLQINNAIVYGILETCRPELESGGYINDGERNIQHETRFQEFLIRGFQFRNAFCQLHVRYRPSVKAMVCFLNPFRCLLEKFDRIGFIHRLCGVLTMEEIVRKQRKEKHGTSAETQVFTLKERHP